MSTILVVNNVYALRHFIQPKHGMFFKTLGKESPFDGGSNDYMYRENETALDDGEDVVNHASNNGSFFSFRTLNNLFISEEERILNLLSDVQNIKTTHPTLFANIENIGVIDEYDIFEETDTLQLIIDENGVERVLTHHNTVLGAISYAETPNSLSVVKSALALDELIDYPFDMYPNFAKTILDDDNVVRLIEVFGDEYTGDNLFGATTALNKNTPVCYVVFMIAGQSNAEGRGNYLQAPTLPAHVGLWYKSSTGTLEDVNHTTVSNTSSGTGNAWPAFALEYYQKTGFGVVFVPCAVGGTGQTTDAAAETGAASWDTAGSLRSTAVSRFNAALAALDAAEYAYQIGGVLWCQGERDAGALDSTALASINTYKTAFANMVTYFRAQLSATLPVFISQTGRTLTADTAGYQAVRLAQSQLVREVNNVYLAYTAARNFVTRGLMIDEYHYHQTAYNDMGKHLATVAVTKMGVN